MRDVKIQTKLFKAFANISRLKIIVLLSKEKELAVTEIAKRIHVTIKGTSQHLQILAGLGIVDRDGRAGQVLYSLDKHMDSRARALIDFALQE